MRAGNVWRLWWVRLRARWAQECLAAAGIAAGVALLLASQVADSSLHDSVAQLERGVAGRATLQLRARDPHGFPQSLVARVRRIAGVREAAPIVEVPANAIGPLGSRSVEVVGADPSLRRLGGRLVRDAQLSPFGEIGAIVLPVPLARAIGVTHFGQEAILQASGRTMRAPLYAQLRGRQIGSLVESPVAVAPLFFAQQIAGMGKRVSRILVEAAPGARAGVTAALESLAAGRMNVEPVGYDERLFSKAAEANDRATALFAAISALVGFLLAFNAMLLTLPGRRRLVGDLRRDGYSPRTAIAVLALDALMLGAGGCALGLALGDVLSIRLFGSNPAFLSLAFALGAQRVVSLQSVAVAVAGGMGAALVAVLSPLREVLARDPLIATGMRERTRAARLDGWLALVGVLCAALASTVLAAASAPVAPLAAALLAAALLLELPLALTTTLALVRSLARLRVGAVAHVATMELEALRTRAVAIAATGAVAVFGAVAIEGAHRDLLAGLERAARDTSAVADVWVAPTGAYNLLDTVPLHPDAGLRRRLARLAGVRAVGLYRSALLDYGERRVLAIAPSRALGSLRVRDGWVVLSRPLAEEHGLRAGDAVTLPTPRPTRLRIAALSDNLGWEPGAVVMSGHDYARAWSSADASAYALTLARGADLLRVRREIERVLGPHAGLSVQSAAQRAEAVQALDRRALERLDQIAVVIPIAAVLAMAAAMAATLVQRRPQMARLKLEGFARRALWHTTLLQSAIVLGVGCMLGASVGLYGQRLADRALARAVGFPVAHSLALTPAAENLALVVLAALAIVALPGYLAAKVSPRMALGD